MAGDCYRATKTRNQELVFKAHRWLYHSTLGARVIKKRKKESPKTLTLALGAIEGERALGAIGRPGCDPPTKKSIARKPDLGPVTLSVKTCLCPYGTTYRGTSLIRNRLPVGPYRRPMPRALGRS